MGRTSWQIKLNDVQQAITDFIAIITKYLGLVVHRQNSPCTRITEDVFHPSPVITVAEAKFSCSAALPARAKINRHVTAHRDNLTLRFVADADCVDAM